ncbi:MULTISPECIES: alkaline phosphatase D family protein [unclassified Streptomyces]|uniref:alkaline phosphatase D family protein n=1 Tax=unclassified Streptomyces TaxID=2593676 RepID=UPI00038282B6|nr:MULTISPECIES: alkaline phosphatase D family protein [unclassified Streptomyces]MYT27422.1 alkaline phosphatase [Streptomyces sp. SID8354]
MGQGSGGGFGRRSLLQGAAAGSAALALPAVAGATPATAAPALVRSGRPRASWGVQAGDVTASSGLVWVRSDRPARMVVQTAATESFRNARTWQGPLLGPGTDFTGVTALHGLPAGEQVHYRVLLADPDHPKRTGEPVAGTFRTAPERRRDMRFLWSGDLAGQGWGINPERGGYRVYEDMRRRDPDFFLCSGDNIYADNPIPERVTLPDGRIWRNVTTEEKSKVAETPAEFRGAFRYNLLDENLRRFNSQVPTVIQWDDHEVHNNWYPGQLLDDDRYRVKDVDVLSARALRAFSEYFPVRTLRPDARGRVYRVLRHGPLLDVFVLDMRRYRNANSPDRQTADPQGILGAEQLRWLKRELSRSRAVWKVIAADMPLGLVVTDGPANFEAVAQGDPGAPLGRELQIAELLRHIKHRRITGTLWLTADVHYTSAQHYAPERAAFKDFEPFWEFVSGPLCAGGFPAVKLDGTFGPAQPFIKAPDRANVSPAESPQYFGEVDIDGGSGELTVRLCQEGGEVLFTKTLQPGWVGQ